MDCHSAITSDSEFRHYFQPDSEGQPRNCKVLISYITQHLVGNHKLHTAVSALLEEHGPESRSWKEYVTAVRAHADRLSATIPNDHANLRVEMRNNRPTQQDG